MKKFILASAFALMATPALFAQSSNTYSMQIELKDGTKITLGPNDLKNITFVDGVIKIEGNTIEELRSSIAKAEANTKNMVQEQRYDLDDLKKNAAELQAMIDYLSDKVAKLENAGGGSGNTEDITALQAAIAMLQSELAKLQSSEMATKTDVAATNEKINNVQAMVKATEAAIMDLQEAVKGLSSGSSGSGSVGNEERIKLLEEAVNNLKADMKNLLSIEQIKQLQDQIYNLQAMVDVVATNSTGNQAQTNELKVRLTALENLVENMSSYITTNQSNISELRTASLANNEKIAVTRVELMDRINSIEQDLSQIVNQMKMEIRELSNSMGDNRVEYMEALAKTNNNLDSVSVTILHETQAEIDQLAAAINAMNKDSRVLIADLEKKIDELDSYTKSWVPSIQNSIEQEKADREVVIGNLERAIAANKALTDNQLVKLQTQIDMIIAFLNANIFNSNYGENAFNKWLERQ